MVVARTIVCGLHRVDAGCYRVSVGNNPARDAFATEVNEKLKRVVAQF